MPTINSITDTTKFKKWIETINAIISALRPATQTSEGLLSASDKKKLDSIESGASRTDIDNLTIGVNNGGTSILIEGNTGNTSNIIFKQGSGVEIASTESEENSTKNYTVTISASSYSQATGATETSNGTLGLIQATAGSPERMLFADMTWRESEDTLNADSKYPISSKAVKDALNDYAQIDHASTETIYGVGNEHEYGHVKLTDTSNNTLDASSGIAVSPKALYDVSMTAERAERQANENASVISSLQSSIVGAYRYAGSVDTYEELLQISASVGDVYNVASPLSSDGPNYAWNGMSWDNLSGILSVDTQVVEGSNNAVTSDAVYNEIIKLAPKNHASEDTRYGVSDSEHYGHVKLTDDINASYALSDGYAATPSITNKIWKYSQETRELVKESNFTVFQSADEAYIPDVYDDPDAPTTVPSKVAFAEVNSVVSEITERVENIELNYAKKSGDEFTGNVSFLAGTRKNIVSLNGADNLVIIDPSLADNFSLDCINTEYEIDISNIDASSVTFSLVVKGGENVTFVWPDNVRWSNSMEPLLSSGIDILKFYTIDGGENWYVTHELSNSNISLDVYGIITENDGYLYRITSKMMSKWKMPIGDEVVLSSASFSSGEYYILTEDDTTNVYNIYLYNNESFGLYKTLSKTDYRLKKIYSDNNNLYLIGNNSIYVVNGDSYDVIYSVENGDTNEIIDFVMYYSKPYIVVSSNDVFHVYYANETDAIDGDIEITEFSVGENKKACFSIIDNRLYLASENGTMMIDASSKALIVPIFYRFSCSDLISFNEKILCYFNNGVGIIENDENGVYINDWKYVGEKYNVSDIKSTHIGVIISGSGGEKYNDFGKSLSTSDNEKLFDFTVVKIPYTQDVARVRQLDNTLDFSKNRYYHTSDVNKSCNEISLREDYTFSKPWNDSGDGNYIYCIITDSGKFSYVYLNFMDDGMLVSSTHIPCDNRVLKMGSSSDTIGDDIVNTTDVNFIVDCHTSDINQSFFAGCDNGYIIDNLKSNNNIENAVVRKIGNVDNDKFVCGYYYSTIDNGVLSEKAYAITKTGYMTSYNFTIGAWTDAVKTTLQDGNNIDECMLITMQNSDGLILYAKKDNSLLKCLYHDDTNQWEEKVSLYDFDSSKENITYECSIIMEEDIVMALTYTTNGEKRSIILDISPENNEVELVTVPNVVEGYVTNLEVVGDYCYMTTSNGMILAYRPTYGCHIVFSTYGLHEFSGFLKTYDNGNNSLYAVTRDGMAFMYNMMTDEWVLKENFYVGAKRYFSASGVIR